MIHAKFIGFLAFIASFSIACNRPAPTAAAAPKNNIASLLCQLRNLPNNSPQKTQITQTINSETQTLLSARNHTTRSNNTAQPQLQSYDYEILGNIEREAMECGCTREFVRNFFATDGIMGQRFRAVIAEVDTLQAMILPSKTQYLHQGETFIRHSNDSTTYWELLRNNEEQKVVSLKKITFPHHGIDFCTPQKDSIDMPERSGRFSLYKGEHYQIKICPQHSAVCEETYNARLTTRVACDSVIALYFDNAERAKITLSHIQKAQALHIATPNHK